MTDRQYGRHSKKIYEWDEVDETESASSSVAPTEAASRSSVADAMVVEDTPNPAANAKSKNPLSKMFRRKLF